MERRLRLSTPAPIQIARKKIIMSHFAVVLSTPMRGAWYSHLLQWLSVLFILKSLRDRGDFGIGTFDDLEGDLVLLDGRGFQLLSDGRVKEVNPEAMTPFACVTDCEPISHDDLERELDYPVFRDWLHDLLPSPNLCYALRIEGSFATVEICSPAQPPVR